MQNKIIRKLKSAFSYSFKLFILTSLLFSQLSLSEFFLYQNNLNGGTIKIAKANTADTWYNASYLYRKEITINSAKVPNTDQSNFPALISLTDPAFRTVANGGRVTNTSGYDIIFANQAGGAKLDHEIESYDAATGTIVMWVKIPVLSHINNTVIYVYYGNVSISTTQENKAGVWDDGGLNNFKAVWHMNEDPSGVAAQMSDSTQYGNNSTSGGGMTTSDRVAGRAGNALDFDGSDDYVSAPNSASLSISQYITVETWVNYGGYVHQWSPIIWKDGSYTMNLNTTGATPSFGAAGGWTLAPSPLQVGVWTHIAGTYDGTNVRLFINGLQVDSPARTGNITTNTNPVYSGLVTGLVWRYRGRIDESRISNSARSADWILTEYNNQSNATPGAGNFILPLGTEEAYATSYNLTAPSPSSGLVNTPSQNFTITPGGVYTGTITITPDGGGLSLPITKTFINSSTPQTFTITPTIAGTVTLTPTNSGILSNPSAITYGSISFSAGSSSVIQGSTGNIINLTGISTSWTSGTPGVPTFTLSGGTGASITSQTITDPTHATLTISAGSATGSLTITDPSTGAITTIMIVPNTFVGMTAFTKPVIQLQDNRIDINNLPKDIYQIAISRTPDFKDVSWEEFSNEEIKKLDNFPDKLYIKFRNKSGAVSDVIVYTPKTSNNLQDGDIVKTTNNPDVYIIKIKNNKQYKRLILSPSVFQSYGHLKWSNLKFISQEELNQYAASSLVKETTDTIIYELFPNGDIGERRAFDIGKTYDADSVYEINKVDRDSYRLVKKETPLYCHPGIPRRVISGISLPSR